MTKKPSDLIVVGSGLYGATVARVAAERGMRVAVVERRSHIAGNAYDEVDEETGIRVHRYGAHIFHTSSERVWDFLSRFTEWVPYEHRVWTRHDGKLYPLPFGLALISQFYGAAFSPEQARDHIEQQKQLSYPGAAEGSLEWKAINSVGRELYEAFVKGYTEKQWNTPAHDLPADVISRLPVHYSYDTRYFHDTHQAMPKQGYTEMVARMLHHPGISVHLNSDALDPRLGEYDVRRAVAAGVPVVYTGPIDRYFGYAAGHLSWRTLDFEWETLPLIDYQGTAVINEADADVPYTRTIEFKHFHPEQPAFREPKTVIALEYARFAGEADEPYYPVNAVTDRTMLDEYRALAKLERGRGVIFGGRLGTYQYLDMHMAVASALTMMDRESIVETAR